MFLIILMKFGNVLIYQTEISVFNSERKAGEAIGKSGTFIRRALLNNTVYNNYKWERI